MRLLTRRALLFLTLAAPAAFLQAATSDEYYLAGFDLYAHKNYEKSIPYLKAAVQTDPQNWKAYKILGYDYYLSRQLDQALGAFDQSLRWKPDDPELWNVAEGIRAKMIWEAERSDIYPRVFRNYDIWVRLHAGVMTASLGDLPKAVSPFKNYFTPTYGHATASVDGFGPLAGLEVGFMLDTYDAWGVVFDGAALNGYTASAKDNFGNYLNETIQPDMVSIQAEYYRFFKLGRSRLYANLGGGFYTSIVNLNIVNNGVTIQSGEMGGLGFGGFLGLGWEMAVADQLSASLYARGRWATTAYIQGVLTGNNGSSQLQVLSTDPTGVVSGNNPSAIGTPGYKAINIDYIGTDAGLSISYHY